jgi:hypothetical protein
MKKDGIASGSVDAGFPSAAATASVLTADSLLPERFSSASVVSTAGAGVAITVCS